MIDCIGEIRSIVACIHYPGLVFEVNLESRASSQGARMMPMMPVPQLRVKCPEGRCSRTGAPAPWTGRWWRLSFQMVPGEIVQTAFKATLTALEHEAREQFTYKGAVVFGPHFDIDKLVELARSPEGIKERG